MEKTDQTLRAGQRAWVGWDETFTIDVLETTPRLKVEAHAHIKNFGHGPALKVTEGGWFETNAKTIKSTAKFACDSAVKFATGTVPHGPGVIDPGPMGYSLFPDQGRRVDVGSPRDPWQGEGQPNLKFFWFVACVAYLDQFNVPHWSRLVMQSDSSAGLKWTPDLGPGVKV